MKLVVIAVIVGTVALSACAQIVLKAGLSAPKVAAQIASGGAPAAVAVITSPLVLLGLGTYGLSMIVWLWVLSKVDVSFAYPFVGLSFILTAALAAVFLHETVSAVRLVGTALIALGCVLVAQSAGS